MSDERGAVGLHMTMSASAKRSHRPGPLKFEAMWWCPFEEGQIRD